MVHLVLTNPTIRNTKLGLRVAGHKILYRPEFDIYYRLRLDEYLSKIDQAEANVCMRYVKSSVRVKKHY